MMVTILFLIILLLLIRYYYLHYTKKGRLYLLPGPSAIPVFGNTLSLIVIPPEKLLKAFCNLNDQYYPIFKLWNLSVIHINIRHPNDMEIILSSKKCIEKSNMYKFLHPWLQTGLITSGDTKWQTRRKILTPTFHHTILKQFAEILIEECNCMITTLKNVKGTIVKDLVPFMSNFTLNAICKTSMGINLRDTAASHQYLIAIRELSNIASYRSVRIWLHNDWLFRLLPIGRMHKKYVTIVHNFTDKIIKERKLYHELTNGRHLTNIENDEAEEIDDIQISGIKKKRFAMLDLLIAVSRENNMTDLDIREEVDTFMFAGHDTAASAACFTLMLLAEHEDIQDRVRFEFNTVMKENDNKLTMSVLQKLSYLERCIKESLRLYPSVTFIARQISTDVKLQSYIIPAGTSVNLFIYGTHRDPHFWPNPDVFDPDRFLPERCQNRHPYAYIPFSAGPRNCIGQRYAILELKAIIASLVHNFYLKPVDYLKDIEIKPDLVLRPNCPVRMKFVPIESI